MSRRALVALLLLAIFGVQAHFFAAYPQAPLFGDAAAYHQVGERLRAAIADGRGVAAVRGVLYFAGVGSVYAALEAIRPGDLGFARIVFALLNTGSALAAFLVARRIGGFAGGVAALVMALFHPSFATQTGRLLPDPVTAFCFAWSAALLAEGAHRKSARFMIASGFTLALGLFVRSQLMNLTLGFVAFSLIATARFWVRGAEPRRMVAGFVAGGVPILLLWGSILIAVKGETREVEQLGNFTFGGSYPYGFWQFLDSDGWMGPYRLKTEPYYRALEQARTTEPELLRSRPRQLRFTAGYIASRAGESLLLVLDNVYRQHARPANDYKWDYPIPYRAQLVLQGGTIVLGLCGLAAAALESPVLAGVFVMPLVIAAVHGLAYPWPRFAQPVMPIWIALAGGFVGWLASRVDRDARRKPMIALVVTTALVLLAVALDASLPSVARLARLAASLAMVAAPVLALAAVAAGRSKRAAALVFAALALPILAHAIRDRRWHETEIVLDASRPAVEQQIALTQEALATLRSASEAKLVFDMTVPGGDVSGLSLEVQGRALPGTALEPTIPAMRESITIGGRERRAYPQWWAVALPPDLLPRAADEPLRVVLRAPGGLTLRADRFSAQDRLYQGPSFGDWPNLSAVKLEYDGDYRLPITMPLASRATRGALLDAAGGRRELRAVLRIRLVTLAANVGTLAWETAPAPRAPRTTFGFAAVSGNRGQGELVIDGRPAFTFPLGAERDLSMESQGLRLCHVFQGIKQEKASGAYLVSMPVAEVGKPLPMELRFRTGMSVEPMFFVLDKKGDPLDLSPLRARCGFEAEPFASGMGRLIDATRNNYPEDFGRWRVAAVY